jgi:hypothetical protein
VFEVNLLAATGDDDGHCLASWNRRKASKDMGQDAGAS